MGDASLLITIKLRNLILISSIFKCSKRFCAAKIMLNKLVFKDLTESNFLEFRAALFQSLAADAAKERPPSLTRL